MDIHSAYDEHGMIDRPIGPIYMHTFHAFHPMATAGPKRRSNLGDGRTGRHARKTPYLAYACQ